MKVELNSYDLQIVTTRMGDRVCQLRPSLGFNADFIKEMEEKGVQEYVREEKEEEDPQAGAV